FHQATSAALCAAIGQKLGSEVGGRCILLTGGNAVVHEAVARPFFNEVGRDRCVFHLCPLGRVCHFDFGVIVGAGSDSNERREIFARSCSACIAVEGGPGTMDEMKLALTNGVPVLAVKRSGGASEEIYHSFPDGLPKPRGVDKALWDRLSEESGTPEETAEVVVKIIGAMLLEALRDDQSRKAARV
ncbi:HERC1, partial [Symbiodinium sp. KB8]